MSVSTQAEPCDLALSSGVPELDELSGDWMAADDLAHLPSLRNQWGQGHVNRDLSSLSWLAFPPYSGGYHTGALRIDGNPPAAQRMRWSAWGVERAATSGPLSVATDVRMGYERSRVLWRITVRNDGPHPVTASVEQELLAMFAHSEVDWGWLYGCPWNSGHHHDFYTTERLRAEVTRPRPSQVQLHAPGERWVRIGSPGSPASSAMRTPRRCCWSPSSPTTPPPTRDASAPRARPACCAASQLWDMTDHQTPSATRRRCTPSPPRPRDASGPPPWTSGAR